MDDSHLYGSELIYKGYKNASSRGLGKLIKLSDVDWQDQKAMLRELDGSFLIDREIITSRHLSKSTDLEKVFSSKEATN